MRVNYSGVTATIALAVALSTGGAYAVDMLLPKDSVGPKQIRDGAVRSSDVRDGSLRRADFKSGARLRGEIGPQGPPGPQGPAGERGVPRVFHAEKDAVDFTSGEATVVSQNLPAGSFFVLAKVVSQYGSTSTADDPVSLCRLRVSHDGVATELDHGATVHLAAEDGFLSSTYTFTLSSSLDSSVPSVVKVDCAHNSSKLSSGSWTDIRLTAVPVGSIG